MRWNTYNKNNIGVKVKDLLNNILKVNRKDNREVPAQKRECHLKKEEE